MRAIKFHGIRQISMEEVPAGAALRPGDLRLKVLAAGICGSDLHNYQHGQWISKLPVTPGHEFAAEVVEIGGAVKNLAPGDHVVADSRVGCGTCAACLAGHTNRCAKLGFVGEVCEGGFAEEVILPATQVIKVDHRVPPAIAALAEPLAVALHALNRLAPVAGAPVLVAGGGTIGGLTCVLLNHLGYGPIFLAEKNAARRDLLVQATGAIAVNLSSDADPVPAETVPLRYAIEATGSSIVLNLLIRRVAPGGRVALVGLFNGTGAVDLNAIVEREIELSGSSAFATELAESARLLPILAPRLAGLVSSPIGLRDVQRTYEDLLQSGSPHLKTIIDPSLA
jgi:(R,R)-butanediol dehydrogenase/meso-butanediol dehydrogenase/diacetyl reductase